MEKQFIFHLIWIMCCLPLTTDGLITFGRTRAMQLRERNELEQKRKMLTLIDDEHQDYTFNSDQYQDAEQQQPQQHMKHHHDDLTVELQGNESKFVQHLNVMPTFDLSISENITIAENDTATLNCRVHNLGTKSVVWVRHSNINLLAVGRSVYSTDERFRAFYDAEKDIWSLQLNYAQKRDSGIYECQVSISPNPIGVPIYLSVVEPITTILGGPDMFINAGSTIRLTCIVRDLPHPPHQLTWYHNNQEINFDSARGGVSVVTERGDNTTSNLYVQRAKHSDSGIYACIADNTNKHTINVYILKEEKSAASIFQDDENPFTNAGRRFISQVTLLKLILLLFHYIVL